MPPSEEDVELFERLIATSCQAFAGGHYGTAYHALAAAMSLAQDMADVGALAQVVRIAREQLTWIDQYAPQYEQSSRSAAERGERSVYQTLASTASITALLLKGEY